MQELETKLGKRQHCDNIAKLVKEFGSSRDHGEIAEAYRSAVWALEQQSSIKTFIGIFALHQIRQEFQRTFSQ